MSETSRSSLPTVQHTNRAPSLFDVSHWRELVRYRTLLGNLVGRDLKVRYRNSLLGIMWSLLNPLMTMAILTLVFGRFLGSSLPAYPIFILVGIMPWNFFSASITAGTESIVGNNNLIKKVYFPREILTVATVLSNLINLLIVFGVLVIMLYIYGIGLTRHAWWVPAILLAQIMFTLGMVFGLSALQVLYRDVAMVLEVALLGFFFLTPVFYTLEQFNRTTMFGVTFDPARVMRWVNPMASIIDGYRTVLWGTINSGPAGMGLDFVIRTLLTAGGSLVIGYVIFRKYEPLFGELL